MKNRKSYEVKIMKYEEPMIEIIDVLQNDIITKSPGNIVPNPNPPVDEEEPDWGLPF